MKQIIRGHLPSLVAFVFGLAALVPSGLALPQHLDEGHYAYISDYYGGKLSRLDFRQVPGEDEFLDPGWAPITFWTLTQPMGPRYLYAAALGITQAPPPVQPWPSQGSPVTEPGRDPVSRLSPLTLAVMRSTAIFLASLGLALMSYRLRWPGVIAIGLFLLIPHVRDDLSRGWAEGPLMLGFGLAAVAWGSRWFAPVCGLAVLFKLTALPLWLLAFHHGFGTSRYRSIAGICVATIVWTALEPPAWFMGGPLYLGMMLRMRVIEAGIQDTIVDPEVWGGFFGHYVPTRYLWPVELGLLLALAWLVSRRLRRRYVSVVEAQ